MKQMIISGKSIDHNGRSIRLRISFPNLHYLSYLYEHYVVPQPCGLEKIVDSSVLCKFCIVTPVSYCVDFTFFECTIWCSKGKFPCYLCPFQVLNFLCEQPILGNVLMLSCIFEYVKLSVPLCDSDLFYEYMHTLMREIFM